MQFKSHGVTGLIITGECEYWRAPDQDEKSDNNGKFSSAEGSESPISAAAQHEKFAGQPKPSLNSLLTRSPEDWTEDELKRVADHRRDLPDWDPEKESIWGKEKAWHSHFYGDQPVPRDETGKMVEIKPIRPFPTEASRSKALEKAKKALAPRPRFAPSPKPENPMPKPVKPWPDNPFVGGFKKTLAKAVASDGAEKAVKGLQAGLNMLADKGGDAPRPVLKEDGLFGPKTQAATDGAAALFGAGRLQDGLALGRFKAFAEEAEETKNPWGLEETVVDALEPLYGDKAEKPASKVLQETLNDLDDDEELKVDGRLGPKTTNVFGRALERHGPRDVTQWFGFNLGLL